MMRCRCAHTCKHTYTHSKGLRKLSREHGGWLSNTHIKACTHTCNLNLRATDLRIGIVRCGCAPGDLLRSAVCERESVEVLHVCTCASAESYGSEAS